FQCLADCLLRAGKVLGGLNELRGTCARFAQPSAQCLPCDVAALEMADSGDVDERALGGVDAQRGARVDVERLSAHVKGLGVELVQAAWGFRSEEHTSE